MFGHLNHGKPELDGSVTITTGAGADISEYTAGGTIVAGDVVMVQLDGKVVQSTGALGAASIGVALEAAVSGDKMRVCIAGPISGVNCTAALAAGSPVLQGAVAGRLNIWDGTSVTPAVAVTLGAVAALKVSVYWYRRA